MIVEPRAYSNRNTYRKSSSDARDRSFDVYRVNVRVIFNSSSSSNSRPFTRTRELEVISNDPIELQTRAAGRLPWMLPMHSTANCSAASNSSSHALHQHTHLHLRIPTSEINKSMGRRAHIAGSYMRM